MGEDSGGGRKIFWGITRNIFIAGIVSCFMDISSEMAYAVGPLFLAALGTTPAVLGLIEGIAEATAAVFKFFSGAIADKFQRYKPLVTVGYFISALSRPLMAIAPTWHYYLGGRIADRFGKGVRTAPRDAIIAASAERKSYGKSFGFHRAMDQSGAILGPIIASVVLVALAAGRLSLWPAHWDLASVRQLFTTDIASTVREYRWVIWLAIVPGIAAVAATFFLVETGKGRAKEKHEQATPKPAGGGAAPAGDARRFWYLLAVMFVFSVGNSSNAFLLLRAKGLGVPEPLVPLAYAAMNVVYVAASIPWGIWADRIGFRRVMLMGFAVFSAVYFGFGAARAPWLMWVLFPAYGLFESAFEGQSRAYLATLAKAHLRGTAFGLYNMLLALTALPASVIAGYLYYRVAPQWAFYYGGITAAAAFVMLAGERLVIGRAKAAA